MFNVTVLKMKDIKKYCIGMIVTITAVIVTSKYIPQTNQKKNFIPKALSEKAMVECLEETLPAAETITKEEKTTSQDKTLKEENLLQGILETQISSMKVIEKANETVTQEKQEEIQDTKEVEKAETGLTTQVITNNPLKESYNTQIR